MIRSKSDKIFGIISTVICVIFALLCLYPLIYTLGMSFMSQAEWDLNGRFMIFFPQQPVLTAYAKAFGATENILRALGVTLFRSVLGTLLSVILSAIVGYVLSRQELPGRKAYTYLVMFTILFSGGLIPGYVVVRDMGLLNSVWSMIIPGAVNTWNALIFKQFFEGVPKDITEAARVDGVNELQMLFRIMLPTSKSVFAAISLFTIVGHWNSWFDAKLYIDAQNYQFWPLQLYIQLLFDQAAITELKQLEFIIQGNVPQRATRMALTIVSLLPVLIIFPFFQKYFTKGVYMGAVKG